MSTSVVLLNGAPSAGKTTLARALHRALPEPTFYLSLDDFRQGIRVEFWTGETHVRDLFRRMVAAYLKSLEAVAEQGIDVVAEAVVLPDVAELYAPLFARFDVTLVGVRCPLAVSRRREARRSDRRNGPVELDVPEFELVHAHDYVLEVDTSVEPTDVSVARIRHALAGDGP